MGSTPEKHSSLINMGDEDSDDVGKISKKNLEKMRIEIIYDG